MSIDFEARARELEHGEGARDCGSLWGVTERPCSGCREAESALRSTVADALEEAAKNFDNMGRPTCAAHLRALAKEDRDGE